MPASAFNPYSALEVGASRSLRYAHMMPKGEQSAGQVMIEVVRWMLLAYPLQAFARKPFNSILAEVHDASAVVDGKRVSYLAEQVTHHPPVFAYAWSDEGGRLRAHGHVHFEARFEGRNSMRISSTGGQLMEVAGQTLHFARTTPDMVVSNLLFGTKSVRWDGTVEVTSDSGWRAEVTFSQHRKRATENVITGVIEHAGSGERHELVGAVGGVTYIDGDVLLDWAKMDPIPVHYPPPGDRDELDSLAVWAKTAAHIVANEPDLADAEKRAVELAQRERRAADSEFTPRFFSPAPDAAPEVLRNRAEDDDTVATWYQVESWARVGALPLGHALECGFRDPVLASQLTKPA